VFEIKAPKNQVNKPPVRKVHKLFEGAMDDAAPAQERPKTSHLIAEMSQSSYQKMLDETSKIVMEDPDIYSYDDHYDDFVEKRQEIEQQKRKKTGPKYIQGIQKTTEKRKVEQSMIKEKIAEKDLQREGLNTGGQKYVTGSYKRMMDEGKKFLQEDAEKEQYNKQHTAENQDNSLGMYKDLYQQDIFMGGHRPDLSAMIKQDKNPAPKPQEAKLVQQIQKQENPVPIQTGTQPAPQSEQKNEDKDKGEKIQEEKTHSEASKGRDTEKTNRKSRSRSRTRSKSPSRLGVLREEAQAPKEPEKELTKEEKLKLAKERYLQRKLNSVPGPHLEQS